MATSSRPCTELRTVQLGPLFLLCNRRTGWSLLRNTRAKYTILLVYEFNVVATRDLN